MASSPGQSLAIFILCGLLSVGIFFRGDAQELPSLEAARISESDAPGIDGKIDDKIWATAALIPNLTQQYPEEQGTPSERTEIRLCYDNRNLYVAFRCFDSDPEKINASIMQRDQTVGPDDYVAILLDPYDTGREGFYFRLNANGAKGDGRITQLTSKVQMDWDAIWLGKAEMNKEGWTAEFAIPFRSLAFEDGKESWRVNFNRWLPRNQERNRWSGALLTRRFTQLEDSGYLNGLCELERGLGIDIQPFALGRNAKGKFGNGFESEFGGDVFWQMTPSLTTTLTINTDFAETEVDDRIVNLTRFPLFYPEKRDFFLEGSEFFEFGPYSSSLRAFHSRTVGLSSNREKVPILGGLKMTGREGPLGIGLLGVGLDGIDGLAQDDAYATRLTWDADDHSRIGSFFSVGDPRGNGDNSVAGLDYSYKNPHFIDDQMLEVTAYELMSDDDGNTGHAFGIEVEYPNDPLQWRIDLRQIDEAFRPGLGFVRRPGTRRLQAGGEHRWYPEDSEMIRRVDVGTGYVLTTTLDDEIESMEWDLLEIQIEAPSGDDFFLTAQMSREVLFDDFEISDGVVLSPDDYRFNDLRMGFATTNSRPVSLELSGTWGEFWDGERWGARTEVEWRASKHFGLEAGGRFDDISLSAGEFEVLVGFAGFRVTPTPRLSWNVIAQWDNVSDEFGLNSRVRWIVAPGKDVFFVVNRGYEVEDDRSFRSLGSETVAKVGWTFRF